MLTIIKNVNKIKPRYIYTFNLYNSNLDKKLYFNLSKSKSIKIPDNKVSKELLENTVKKNLITDTKIVTFLYGGI